MRGLTDIHSHLLPGVDDGAESLKETIELLKMEMKQGVTRVFFTPHYRTGMFEASEEQIRSQFLKLRRILEQAGNPVQIYLGRECYADSKLMGRLREGHFLTMNRTSFVLVEFPYELEYQRMRRHVSALIAEGYDPILAHVERYDCIQRDMERLEELRQMGAWIQVNAGSILGKSGLRQKRLCKRLIEADYVDFVGSDAHDPKRRVPNLGNCYEYVRKKFGERYAERIFYENPRVLYRKSRRM